MNKDLCLMIYLSDNMWEDSATRPACTGARFSLELTTEKETWDEIIDFAVARGFKSILVDVGDGILYKSHPEIAVKGAWTPEFMNAEVKRLKAMGLKVYPKLNFSAGHDAWLGIYSRMLSTPTYYAVVKDLIKEVCEIFETPELFHLGCDEENGLNQQKLTFACYRQFELIWHDLNFYFDCVRECGSRPWIWADWSWTHYDEFIENIPKDVMISPWYYGHMYADTSAPLPSDDWSKARLANYRKLSDLGYEQFPCASNHANTYNIDHQFRFSAENLDDKLFNGILVAPWMYTTQLDKYHIFDAIVRTEKAVNDYWK